MDREARVQFLQDQEAESTHLIRDHVTRLERLEAQYGLDLDLLTDIHGASLLCPSNVRSVSVDSSGFRFI